MIELRLESHFLKSELAQGCKVDRERAIDILAKIILAKPCEANAKNPLAEVKMSKAGKYYGFPCKAAALKLLGSWLGWEKGTEADNKLADGLVAKIRRLTHAR
jgi:hypothetical protein